MRVPALVRLAAWAVARATARAVAWAAAGAASLALFAGCSGASPPAAPAPTGMPEPRSSNVLPRAVGDPQAPPGTACFALFEYGLTCLNEAGWQTFDASNSPLRGNLHQVKTCPADHFLIVHTFGLTLFDGQSRWRDVPAEGLAGFVDRGGCDGQNNLWVTHWDGVSRHDGQAWQDFALEQVTSGLDIGHVADIAVAPDGDTWVLLDHGVSHLAGEGWVVYGAETGLPAEAYLDRIQLDADGQPWVFYTGGLLRFDREKQRWQEYPLRQGLSPAAFTFDPEQQIWLAGFGNLLHADPQGMLTDYSSMLASGRAGRYLRDLAVDDRGRLWLATVWGLLVSKVEGGDVVYQMHNSGLAGNDIFSVAVLAGGPDLPEPENQATGSLAGRISLAGEPLSAGAVEICPAWLAELGRDKAHPCQDYPMYFQTQTHPDGSFLVENILPGYYWLTADTGGRSADGKQWSEPVKVKIQPGAVRELGEVVIK